MSSTELVKPSSSKWETLVLIAGFGLLLAATTIYVLTFGREEQQAQLEVWQVSAYDGLSDVDQAVYNALYTAQEDIGWIQYELGPYPDIATLEDYLIAPFAKDLSWANTGRVQWHFRDVVQEGEMQGYTLYHGNGGSAPDQSAYLLVLGHLHSGYVLANHNTIWIHPNPNQPMPKNSTQQSMILEGWKNVVPYLGRDELERLKGSSN